MNAVQPGIFAKRDLSAGKAAGAFLRARNGSKPYMRVAGPHTAAEGQTVRTRSMKSFVGENQLTRWIATDDIAHRAQLDPLSDIWSVLHDEIRVQVIEGLAANRVCERLQIDVLDIVVEEVLLGRGKHSGGDEAALLCETVDESGNPR